MSDTPDPAAPPGDPADGAALADRMRAWREIEAIYDSAPVGLCVLDRDLRFLRINERLAAINGVPAAAHLGRTVREVLPEVADLAEPPLRRVLESGEPALDIELVGETPAQPGVERIWVEQWYPIHDEQGQVAGINIVALDVTEQRRASAERERLLAAAESARAEAERARHMTERLQATTAALMTALTPDQVSTVLAESMREAVGADAAAVATLDADGRTLEYHARIGAAAEWGASSDARLSLDERAPLPEAVRTGRAVYLESRADWAARFPELAPAPVPAPAGDTGGEAGEVESVAALPCRTADRVVGGVVLRVRGARAFAADERALLLAIARQGAAAFERASLYAVVEAANRTKGEFLAVMSHELRTPLNAIGGYAELIEMGIRGPVTDEQRADLARIQQSQRHLIGLVNQVLNYARIETGNVYYVIDDVRLSAAVGAAAALVVPQMQAKGIDHVVDGCDRTLAVRADSEKLQQVLLNLLSNAVKFTEPGGRIRVACRARDVVVEVAVSDTGIGIPRERLGSIFEPFVQVNAQYTRPHDGVGLGLAISRDLARGMGGDLAVESAPGAGSTFTLTLPRASLG